MTQEVALPLAVQGCPEPAPELEIRAEKEVMGLPPSLARRHDTKSEPDWFGEGLDTDDTVGAPGSVKGLAVTAGDAGVLADWLLPVAAGSLFTAEMVN